MQYYVTHGLLLSTQISVFVVVVRLDDHGAMEALSYWLRFIKSRSTGGTSPTVLVVGSSRDLVTDASWAKCVNGKWSSPRLDYKLKEMQSTFTGKLFLAPDSLILDCRDSTDAGLVDLQARILAEHIRLCATELTVPLCSVAITERLSQDRQEHADQPVLPTETVYRMWATELAKYQIYKEMLLQYLHDAGHVVWIKKLDLVALNPQWLTNKLFGRLLQPEEWLEQSLRAEQGRLTQTQLRALLGDIHLEPAIPLLEYFELIALEPLPEDEYRVLVPCLLRPEHRQDPVLFVQQAMQDDVQLMACRIIALREAKTDLVSPAILPRLQAQVAAECHVLGNRLQLGYHSFQKISLEDGVRVSVSLWQDDVTDSIAILVSSTQGFSSDAHVVLAQQLHHYCKQIYDISVANAPDTTLDTYVATRTRLKQCSAGASLFDVAELIGIAQLRAASKNVLLDGSSRCSALLVPESYQARLSALLAQDGKCIHLWSLLLPLDKQAHRQGALSRPEYVGPDDDLISHAEKAIMISYSWGKQVADGTYPQQEIAKAVKAKLLSQGYKVWLDIDHMQGDMDRAMGVVISVCQAVVVCVSPSYHTQGGNAEAELKAAHKIRKPVFPIKTTADTDMHDIKTSFGFRFNGVKYYDASVDFDKSMTELLRDMKAKNIH
eukprot:m.61107 g.61107  ORF g.61107 m.61107 type:complete len:663 (+) comp13868_c1_seq19:1-1989(+)